MREGMGHTSIPLHSDLVPSFQQNTTIVLSFVPFEVKLCSYDMRRSKILKFGSKDWSTDPVA